MSNLSIYLTSLVASSAVALSLLAAPVSAQSFMSEEELLATLPGAQVQSVDPKGKAWAQAYSARNGKKKNGTFNGVWDGQPYKGKWRVKDGQWCEDSGTWQGCFQFVRQDDKTLAAFVDGKKRNPWTLKK